MQALLNQNQTTTLQLLLRVVLVAVGLTSMLFAELNLVGTAYKSGERARKHWYGYFLLLQLLLLLPLLLQLQPPGMRVVLQLYF